MSRPLDKLKEAIIFPMGMAKISTFNPELELPLVLQQRYSKNQKNQVRKEMAQTTISIRRPLQNEYQEFMENKKVNPHRSRLSHFVQEQICKFREGKVQINQYEPLMKQKIIELRSIMHLKTLAMRTSPLKNPANVSFTEYKMNGIYPRRGESILHSRLKDESPFRGNSRQKKYQSESLEIKSKKTLQKYEQSIDVQKTSKENKEELEVKLVLIGGGFTRTAVTTSPEKQSRRLSSNRSIRPYSHVRDYLYRRAFIRNAQQPVVDTFDDRSVDCKPWETEDNHLHESLSPS